MPKSDPRYQKLLDGSATEALFDPDFGDTPYTFGRARVTRALLYLDDEPIRGFWGDVILQMRREYLPFQPFVKALHHYGPDLDDEIAVNPDGTLRDDQSLLPRREDKHDQAIAA